MWTFQDEERTLETSCVEFVDERRKSTARARGVKLEVGKAYTFGYDGEGDA